MTPSIGIIIPTYQAEKHLLNCLSPLLQSPLQPRILVVDSSSTDGTLDLCRSLGVECISIPKASFNHGSTREYARGLLKTSICIMMTQDAYAASPHMLEHLIEPLLNNKASLSYARQLPHLEADPLAAFSRIFNYPEVSHIRSIQDFEAYGAYTFFNSNSCAAYLNSALDEVGGFPQTAFGEDTAVTAKLLNKGHRIAYVAEAQVHHSHNYSLKEEFNRHFAMASARTKLLELSLIEKETAKRGKEYIQCLLRFLLKEKPALIGYALLHLGAKWSGYQLGGAISNFKKR